MALSLFFLVFFCTIHATFFFVHTKKAILFRRTNYYSSVNNSINHQPKNKQAIGRPTKKTSSSSPSSTTPHLPGSPGNRNTPAELGQHPWTSLWRVAPSRPSASPPMPSMPEPSSCVPPGNNTTEQSSAAVTHTHRNINTTIAPRAKRGSTKQFTMIMITSTAILRSTSHPPYTVFRCLYCLLLTERSGPVLGRNHTVGGVTKV